MSRLTYSAETGLSAPDTSEIREAVRADWQAAFADASGSPRLNVEASTPAGQLIDAETAEIAAKNAELLWLANQFNPRTAEGRFQDALGQIYFLTRKIAEPTVVTCKCTGLRGTQIPYGAVVQSTDGYQLVCSSPVTIGDTGEAMTAFRLSETGPIPVAAGTVTKIVTVIAGWDEVTNPAAGALGRDAETRSEFEARRAASVAANAHGTLDSLYAAASAVSGVLDCRVLENTGPDPAELFGVTVAGHSVAVCAYGGEDADIAAAIYSKKDAGCGTSGNTAVVFQPGGEGSEIVYSYRIVRPETVPFYVKVVIPGASALSETVRTAIAAAVAENFSGRGSFASARVGLAQTVYASRFYPPVMSVSGVSQLTGIEIRLGEDGAFAGSVTVNADQEPVMTADNVIIAEA